MGILIEPQSVFSMEKVTLDAPERIIQPGEKKLSDHQQQPLPFSAMRLP